MKCLLIADQDSDFGAVLESCGITIKRVMMEESVDTELSSYDAYIILADGKVIDPRLRVRLEEELAKGKRLFTERLNSWGDIYSEEITDTTRYRLVVVADGERYEIPGLEPGDLLDDGSNQMMRPWYDVPGMIPLLVYREHIVAHRKWNAERKDFFEGSTPGLWLLGDNVMMCAFELHNFNRARFAPQKAWRSLISYIAKWLTGKEPTQWPKPVVCHDFYKDLSDDAVFDLCRKDAIKRGICWLKEILVDEGEGGIKEGLRHNIDPDGHQLTAETVRTDCSGEAAGAFRFYGKLYNDDKFLQIADNLSQFVFGPMLVRDGLLDGMLRWTDTAWQVCYQDDVARALLPELYNCLYFGNGEFFSEICRVLDFLVKTTAKDGCRVMRTDAINLTGDSIRKMSEEEHGLRSAHYNAYYHAALLLAYRFGGNQTYLNVGRRGLESIMSCYPDTEREQSETQEMCRLILPLSVLYDVTKEEKHKEWLYRVTDDLVKHRHASGGYCEWDTGYKAKCSRESGGECSLLTHNGDPVADLLYSTNWLPVGFAMAHHVTGDRRFYELWRDVAVFCLRTQIHSDELKTDGCWCRAFDMEIGEVYACPHDVGWAAKCSESGWTNAEILMGLMLPEILL